MSGKTDSRIYLVGTIYLVFASIFALTNLDGDEFHVIRDPYEILGGDYAVGYARKGDYFDALQVAAKSYYFYWKYRPLLSPIIENKDKQLFEKEERIFHYEKPSSVDKDDPQFVQKYEKRLIVPEPDRFYAHGAGKPLLPAVLSIPQLALVASILESPRDLLNIQYSSNYHPIFIVIRLVQLVGGLLSVFFLHRILLRIVSADKALLGAAILATMPVSIKWFPNLHPDSLMVLFLLLTAQFFVARRTIFAGLFFGLALASKNTAVFSIPALAFVFGTRLYRDLSCVDTQQERKNLILRSIKSLAIFSAIALIALLPFANPVSYAKELATPLISRDFDRRGRDPHEFSLFKSDVIVESSGRKTEIRSEVNFLRTGTWFELGSISSCVYRLCAYG